MSGTPLFKEVQTFWRNPVFFFSTLLLAFLFLRIPEKEAGRLFIGVGVVVLAALHLRTTMSPDAIKLVLFPIWRRTVQIGDISDCEATSYRPIRDFGGWGIRRGRDRTVAYNVSGQIGVRVRLNDGKQVLIGTRNPDALAKAIERAVQEARRHL